MEDHVSTTVKKSLLILNCVLLTIGHCAGPLITRFYFIHGGKRVWLTSLLETVGCPVILIPLLITYLRRRAAEGPNTKLFFMKPRLFLFTAVVGVLTAVDCYLYGYGLARLPVSTIALIIASQLAFTSIFAFLLVKQKFTPYSINAVVLLTVGAAVLALHTSGDRPKGESSGQYFAGFFMTAAAAVLYGFILPLVEWSYMKAKQAITYTLVMEVQLVMCFTATVFSTVGMLINKDFQAIPIEARNFELGEAKYYLVLVWTAIIWQFFYLGVIGVIFCSSSLLSGIIIAVLLPVIETLGVFFYHENFHAEKGVALFLSLWGFISYFYGDMRLKKTDSQPLDVEMSEAASPL